MFDSMVYEETNRIYQKKAAKSNKWVQQGFKIPSQYTKTNCMCLYLNNCKWKVKNNTIYNSTKIIKLLNVNLPKYVQYLYTGNDRKKSKKT